MSTKLLRAMHKLPEMQIGLRAAGTVFDHAVNRDGDLVSVQFYFWPANEEADEAARVIMHRMQNVTSIWFDTHGLILELRTGYDLMPLLSFEQLEAVEEQLLERALSGEFA